MRESIKKVTHLIKIAKVGRGKFFSLVVLAIISSFLSILPTSYLGKISDQILAHLKSNSDDLNIVLKLFITYSLIIIASTIVRNIFCYLSSKYSNKIIYNIRNITYEKLLNISYKYINKSDKGNIINTIYNNTARLEVIFSTALFTLISDFLDLLWISFFISKISVLVLVFLIVGLPVLIYMGYSSGGYQKELYINKIDEEKSMINHITQTFINLDVIRTFFGQKKETNDYDKYNHNYYFLSHKADKGLSIFYIIEKTIRTIVISISLGYIAIGILRNNFSFGSLLVVSMYTTRFYSPVTNIIRYYQMLQKGLASVEDIDGFLKEDNVIRNNNFRFENIENSICVDNITIKGNDKTLLKDFGCKIRDKSINIIYGQSGCGKTTLIKSLIGIYELEQGKIIVNKRYENTNKIYSYASQDIFLFRGSILENIIYPKTVEIETKERLNK